LSKYKKHLKYIYGQRLSDHFEGCCSFLRLVTEKRVLVYMFRSFYPEVWWYGHIFTLFYIIVGSAVLAH
jgi:hypothetical protein